MITDDYIIDKVGIGICKVSDLKNWNEYNGFYYPNGDALPSSHHYWTIQCLLTDAEQYEKHSKQLEECRINKENIKFLYNVSTSLQDIEDRVADYKESVDILKYLNVI